MHILIDIQGAQNGSKNRGIGRYTRAFTKKLCELSFGTHRVSLLVNGQFDNVDEIKREFAGFVHESDIHVWFPFGDVSYRWIGNDVRRKASEYLREAVINELNVDFAIVSSVIEGCDDPTVVSINKHFGRTPTAAIFYDAIPAIYEEEYLSDPRGAKWYYEKIEHLQRSNLLLAISNSSREEAIEYFGISEDKIVNISTAVSDEFCVNARVKRGPSAVFEQKNIGRNYIMYSGASDARKNLHRLIQAYASLPQDVIEKYQLILAGGMPAQHVSELTAEVLKSGLAADRVIFTGWVDDDELAAIYAGASLFVFPSFHEGFGLPVLEAMNYGLPVVASNVSSIPEVVGLEAALFDPFSVDAIAAMMLKGLTDRSFRAKLVKNSNVQATKFSWATTARKALDVIEKYHGAKSKQQVAAGETDSERQYVSHIINALGTDANLMGLQSIIDPINKSLPTLRSYRQMFVDVSALHARDLGTGIQRVVKNVLVNLQDSVGPKYKIIPVYTEIENDYAVSNKVGAQYIRGFKPSAEAIPQYRMGDIFLGLDFQDVLVPLRQEFFDKLARIGVERYFVVYDLLPLKLKHHFRPEVTKNFNIWLNTVAQSDGLIAISECVADDVEAWARRTGLRRSRPLPLGVFRLGADFNRGLKDEPSAQLQAWVKAQKNSPIFVSIGTLEPRKRHDQVIDALDSLLEHNHSASLALVGKKGWFCDDLIAKLETHPELGKRIAWFKSASDADLNVLLKSSAALISASEDEGFGLPIVEAQLAGLPIIARDIPIFREVAGDEATYFRGESGEDLAQAMTAFLDRKSRRNTGGTTTAHLIDWKQSTRELTEVILGQRWHAAVY